MLLDEGLELWIAHDALPAWLIRRDHFISLAIIVSQIAEFILLLLLDAVVRVLVFQLGQLIKIIVLLLVLCELLVHFLHLCVQIFLLGQLLSQPGVFVLYALQ